MIYLQKRNWLTKLVTTTVLTAILLTGCGSNGNTPTSQEPAANQTASSGTIDTEATITYALGSKWSDLMPYNATNYYNLPVVDKIFDTPARIKQDFTLEPRAAKSWEMSEDGLTLTLHLDENATWHDGEPVTAADWLYTIKTISDPALTGAGNKGYLSVLAGIDSAGNAESGQTIGISASDEYTVDLTFDSPIYPESFFLSYGMYYFVLPEHLLQNIAPADLMSDSFWQAPVGSGPCQFVSEISGQQLTLAAYSDYHLGAPQYKQLIYNVVPAANMTTAMMAGEIDVAYPSIAPDEALSLEGTEGIGIQKAEDALGLMWIALNNEKFDKNARQALNLAIDKQMIVDQLLVGEAIPANSNVSPQSPVYNSSIQWERNVEKAKELLAASTLDTSQPITLAIPGGIRERIAAIMQQNLAEIGITLDVIVMDWATIITRTKSGEYDMLMSTSFSSADPTQWQIWYTPGASSISKGIDSTCYTLLQAINAEQDAEARKTLCLEYQEVVADECAYIYLYHDYLYNLVSPNIQNMTILTTDAAWQWQKLAN